MKAYIFSGHMRTFKDNLSNFNFTDSDIYIYTYDHIGYWDPTSTVKFDYTKLTKEDILNYFNPEDRVKVKDIVIEPISSKLDFIVEYSKMMESRKILYARPYNYVSMHMKRLEALERFFSIKQNSYEYILLFRPDYIFTKYSFINPSILKTNTVYIEGIDNYDWLSDIFIIGSEKMMCKLKDIYCPSFVRYIDEYKGLYDPHSYFNFLIKQYFPNYICIDCKGNKSLRNTPGGYCKI
jgi:hypothetical protein